MFLQLRKLFDKKNLMITQTASCLDINELSKMKPLKGIEYRGHIMKHIANISRQQNKLGEEVIRYIQMNHAKSENDLRVIYPVSQQYASLPVKLDMVSVKKQWVESALNEDNVIPINENVSVDFQANAIVQHDGFFKRLRKQMKKLICF